MVPGRVLRDGRELGAASLDLLFPPNCATCGAYGSSFCAGCQAQIVPPVQEASLPGLDGVASVGLHEGPLRDAVLGLKFGGDLSLAHSLARLLSGIVAVQREAWQPQAVVPVPIHWTRQLRRGFNQSSVLAEILGREVGLPVAKEALRRLHRTPPQVGLAREQRRLNVQGAIGVKRGETVAGRVVVLVDDVRTTGATLCECARVLRDAGAAKVFGVTVTQELSGSS